MPDPFELPRVLCAVVPQVFADFALVNKLVAFAVGHSVGAGCGPATWRVPRLAAVVGTLDYLPKPAARLRRIDAVRISRRPFEMVHFPTPKVRPVDLPIFPRTIGSQDECALLRADKNSNSAHEFFLFVFNHCAEFARAGCARSSVPLPVLFAGNCSRVLTTTN